MTDSKQGIAIERYFSTFNVSPYDQVAWDTRTATLSNIKGDVIFEQKNVKVPKSWSMTATNIVASKYFHGTLGSSERETGVDQLVSRVVDTITESGITQGYFTRDQANVFADELATLLLGQYGAFNSPVWFNVGCHRYEPNAKASSWHWTPIDNASGTLSLDGAIVNTSSGYKNPQCSACFINSVEDSMEGIMELAKTEAMLFKFGSGTGTNLSTLRSSKEIVSGGGTASGPLSFMKGYDAFAGVIKSGGKTRRAAKMVILNADHPDVEAFINCKLVEEKKAHALIAGGYDGSTGPDSEAYASICYQNANNSVRASDEFMRLASMYQADIAGKNWPLLAVKDGKPVGKTNAFDLLYQISKATWQCGDPGMQFDDIINKWHTCKASGRINASNPCSEYMFLDNSACNLASLNLLKFFTDDGFDVAGFQHAVEVFIIAQDILVDMAGYPTQEIASNSHDFRPLGLGFANIGALLMTMGLAYDSNEGRAIAGVITSIMTGQAYATSGRLASLLCQVVPSSPDRFDKETFNGAFPGWKDNRDSFVKVMKMHQNAAAVLVQNSSLPKSLADASTSVWKQVQDCGGVSGGFRNSQVTVLAPTGTIGFMMDCDTTGIEPELALVKYKKLVGGGMLKIVNETVESALLNLGYEGMVVQELINYIDAHGSLEGSLINAKHLPVFDTAFKPANGTRAISYLGHIKMMAACQPFLSGAISKTVNLPNEATVADIYQAYVESWELGLKSVAIYRDGSKSNQVLVTSKDNPKELPAQVGTADLLEVFTRLAPDVLQSKEITALFTSLGFSFTDSAHDEMNRVQNLNAPPKSIRHRLPDTRNAVNHKFTIAGHDGYLNIGLYENGQPGEIFITMSKEGSTISGFMDSFALVFSIGLQHGVPLETLCSKLAHTRFEPSGWTGTQEIGFAKSIMDYIARWLEIRFLKSEQGKLFPEHVKKTDDIKDMPTPVKESAFDDAPPCPDCGTLTVRNGSCHKCPNCGSTTGCS